MKITRRLPRGVVKSFYADQTLYDLLEGMKNAVDNHNTSVVIVIDGRSGMGKTTLSNQIGVILDPNYGLHKIHYSPQTFLEGDDVKVGLANAQPGDFILFDEAMLISNRSALTQINKMIIQAMSMIRSKRIYVGFCVNSIFDLDRNLAISRADLLLHVYGKSLVERGRFGAFFKGRDGQDRIKSLYLQGKKLYDYSRPRANFLGRFIKEFVVDEDEYEQQKQVGVTRFLKGVEGSTTRHALEGRNRIISFLYHTERWHVDKIIEVSGLKRTQVYDIIQKTANVV